MGFQGLLERLLAELRQPEEEPPRKKQKNNDGVAVVPKELCAVNAEHRLIFSKARNKILCVCEDMYCNAIISLSPESKDWLSKHSKCVVEILTFHSDGPGGSGDGETKYHTMVCKTCRVRYFFSGEDARKIDEFGIIQ